MKVNHTLERSVGVKWIGRILTLLVAIPFLAGGIFGLSGAPEVLEGMDHFG